MFKNNKNFWRIRFFNTFSPESLFSLLFAGCQYRSNLHCSRRSEPQICLDVQSHRGKLAWVGCPDTQSDLQLISCIAPAFRFSGNILNSPRLCPVFFLPVFCLQFATSGKTSIFGNKSMIRNLNFSASMANVLIQQEEIT